MRSLVKPWSWWERRTKVPVNSQAVMQDPKNALGDKFNPNSWYGLYLKNSVLLTRRLREGGKVVLDDIHDSDGEPMVLLEFPKEQTNE